MYASNFVNSSSKLVKHNILKMNNSVSKKLYQLQPVSFIYNDDKTDTVEYGLIAEDVKELFPNAVIEMPDKQLGIDYTKLIPFMIAEIQSLKEILNERS